MRTPTWPSHPKPSSSCRSRTWPTATMPMRHAPSSARSRHTDAGRTSTSIAMPWNRGWRHSNRGTRAMRCAAFTRLYALRFAKPRWGDKTPGYVKHTRAVQGQAKRAWRSGPPEASRIARWRTEMSADELSEYERVAGRLLAELGYAG